MKISMEITAEVFPAILDIQDDVIREAIDRCNDLGIFNSSPEDHDVWLSSFTHNEEVTIVGVVQQGACYFTKEFSSLIRDNSIITNHPIKEFSGDYLVEAKYIQFLTVNLPSYLNYKLDKLTFDTNVNDIFQFIELEHERYLTNAYEQNTISRKFFTCVGNDYVQGVIYVTQRAYKDKSFLVPFVNLLAENASS